MYRKERKTVPVPNLSNYETVYGKPANDNHRPRGLFARMLLALALLLGAGCNYDLVEVTCADPHAHPVFTRDDSGALQYQGCVADGADADQGEVSK